MSTEFSAGSQALGYLYQARYALYLVLTGNQELEIAIESLDDITFFDSENNAEELLQLKHHTNKQASLSDSSTDFWKTIRVWSTQLKESQILLPGTLLTLVSTSRASDNSIASWLRPIDRNPLLAAQKMRHVANTSTNKSLSKSFEAFDALTSTQQETLINSIQILDSSSNIVEIVPRIKDELIGVRREFRDNVYERLEGWWFSKVVQHLSNNSANPISGFEVQDKICEINDQFKPDALPIDFLDLELSEETELSQDDRRFVLQLKEIAINNKRIEKAILDYYKAFQQRSKWLREELVLGDEIERYEKKLIDEWERYFLMLQDEISGDEENESELKKRGRDIYNWMEQKADFRIRSKVTEPYVMRGSYHMLADRNPPPVSWHPKFLERLTQLLAIT